MNSRSRFLLVALFAAAALQAHAQDPSGPNLGELLAERYAPQGWPVSAPGELCLDPAAIDLPDHSQGSVERDARRGAARVSFSPRRAGVTAKVPTLELELRRHASAEIARQALLARLAAVQVTLARHDGLGDLAFATPAARVNYVAGTQGNLSFVLRSLKPSVDLTPVLAGLNAGLQESAPAEEPSGPRVLSTQLPELAKPRGEVNRFDFELDPRAPQPAAMAFDCSDGASVLKAKDAGFLLYASGPGPVTVTVFLCSTDLRLSQHEFTLQIPK